LEFGVWSFGCYTYKGFKALGYGFLGFGQVLVFNLGFACRMQGLASSWYIWRTAGFGIECSKRRGLD
jgi:hypothetical protein